MSRDYKTSPNPSFSEKYRNTLLLGLFIGYVLGLLSAIGTWMYIYKGPSPFISQVRPNSAAPGGTAAEAENKTSTSGLEEEPVKVPEGKPRFEFYKILPGDGEPVTEQQLEQAAQQPSSDDRYFLQAGSFQNAEDADNLKAKLAMLGMEAAVQAVDLRERGIWHRVRLGPFSSIDKMNQVRASLQQNGVKSSLVKIHKDDPQ